MTLAVEQDPRLEATADLEVTRPSSGPPSALIVAAIALLGVGLFALLEHQRSRSPAPADAQQRQTALTPAPALLVPDEAPPTDPTPQFSAPPGLRPSLPWPPRPAYEEPSGPPPGPPPFLPASGVAPTMPAPVGRLSEPVLVMDASVGPAAVVNGPPGDGVGGGDEPARASLIRNQGMIVPQGAVIAAVLETAIDSTRQGPARAIVSQDALSFDGRRVLIPRGSRLIGTYSNEALPGQRRALVIWTRLIRPDGVAIRLGSPASDPLGRGGIEGKVDTHFFERFNGAILQSALDVGVNLASRGVGAPVYLGGGGAGGVSTPLVPPTIRVRQGAEVTVLVARDLDFSGVAARP